MSAHSAMKLFPLTIVSALIGVAAGAALARFQVGEVEHALAGPDLVGEVAGVKDALPRAEIEELVHDFGRMQRGTSASHEFLITNTGDAPLTLRVGATSCKCTLGEVDGAAIPPGESTKVRLDWTALSLPGKFRQTASVLTNDPRRSTMVLEVEGLVTEMTSMQPSEFLLGEMSADETRSATVYLGAYGGPPLEATARMYDQTSRPDLFDVKVEPVSLDELPVEQATSGVKITVTVSPGLPLGHVTEWIEVHTNVEDLPAEPLAHAPDDEEKQDHSRLMIPLLGLVEGDITLHGSAWAQNLGVLMIGNVKSDQGKEAKLRVAFKGDHATGATLSVGETDPEWLEVEIGDPIAAREGVTHFPLTVRVPAGRPAVVRSGQGADAGGQGEGDARVRLLTNHPVTPEVDLRVRFVVAE